MNQRWRCSDVPWVKLSGTTVPCACRCSVSSPIAAAVCSAASTSPGSRKLALRLGVVRPDAGEAVGLQLDPHLQRLAPRLSPAALLRLLHLRQDAEQVLHVMADLVRDHIGLRELAGLAAAAAEARLELAEERGVEIDLAVVRAIERPHRALRHAAGRARLAARTSRASARDRSGRPSRRYPSTAPRCCRARATRSGRSRRSACRCGARLLLRLAYGCS